MRSGILLTILTLTLGAGAAQAGAIERACLGSDRGGSRALCGCLQRVANVTLESRDQRLAATFFRDPHLAQEVRMSDRQRDEVFWRRYIRFGAVAESNCRAG